MELICYQLLSTGSRKALLKQSKQGYRKSHYSAEGTSLQRLAKKLGWTIDQVAEQLDKERKYLISQEKQDKKIT
jgi:hypothetical protein